MKKLLARLGHWLVAKFDEPGATKDFAPLYDAAKQAELSRNTDPHEWFRWQYANIANQEVGMNEAEWRDYIRQRDAHYRGPV